MKLVIAGDAGKLPVNGVATRTWWAFLVPAREHPALSVTELSRKLHKLS